MIVVFGSQEESMIGGVCGELQRRKAPLLWLDNAHMPASARLYHSPDGGLEIKVDDQWLEIPSSASIYHRLGFSKFQGMDDYSEEESRFVEMECATALQNALNAHRGLVVNPPWRSGSNASKPYQSGLFGEFGFRTPETLVTNLPDAARVFYEALEGRVIYKSISYVRSMVQRMTEADLDRLDTLANCPVQLQEAIEGFDVRVHVVGDEVFPCRIEAEGSDYRYDKEAEISPWELPDPWSERCVQLARKLGLWLTGIDLRFTPDGEVVCFEANPSPAFTWYEARTEQPITECLCDLLQFPPPL